jgi:hypothetical protein
MPEPFLGHSLADRRDALETAAALSGRPDFLLEKDVWVVQALEILFASPFAGDLAFKGGTSLSKAYGAIRRFSEDVDLTYDIRRLAPDLSAEGRLDALSPSQANRWSKRIRETLLPTWLERDMAPLLQARIDQAQLPASLHIDGTDLYIDYQAAAQTPSYVQPNVKLEFGARATGEPTEHRPVVCDAAEHLSTLAFPSATPRVMRVERTFWEKATAMHVFCLQGRYRGDGRGFARHWHDLARLDTAGYAELAVADRDLAKAVASHKSKFFPERTADGAIDYAAAVTGGLKLVAEGEAFGVLEADYAAMQDAGLLLDDVEAFSDLMDHCRGIEARANAAAVPTVRK